MASSKEELAQGTEARTCKTMLPGFGRPLNYIPDEKDPDYIADLFPNALSAFSIAGKQLALPLITLRELAMLQFMNQITDKPQWDLKVHDEEIVQKWKDEIIASKMDMTSKMFDYCINELRYKASLIPPSPAIPPPIVVFNGDVVKSDFAVSTELKAELQEAVIAFEQKIPARRKDWHPGSDEKVWDLVHPSLFPLVYGFTCILENGETTTLDDCIQCCGLGVPIPSPRSDDTSEKTPPYRSEEDDSPSQRGRFDWSPFDWSLEVMQNPFSRHFQWLPCEVDIAGAEARITSYINNLHPKEKRLYAIIPKLITESIPLWDMTIAPLRRFNIKDRKPRIVYTDATYYPTREDWPKQEPDENDDEYIDRRYTWYEENKKVVIPDANEFEPLPEPPKFSLKETYGKQGLQVIVKLANIELTPEKPTYEGGSWHVEGQLNEHIVATSIYYYSCSNVTTSTLSFRQQCEDNDYPPKIQYDQNDFEWLQKVFGCQEDGPCLQELGSVETREGRLLTFPNILQHRVSPFKLEDPTKPGHRKIVALFLVDPNIKVISTAHVPCQQRDWWWDETLSMRNDGEPFNPQTNRLARLPCELQDYIVQQLDDEEFPMSLAEAKKVRLELMEERKDFVVTQGQAFAEITFNLCEH